MFTYRDEALEILMRNFDKIDFEELSANPNAIELLRKNQDKICWFKLFYRRFPTIRNLQIQSISN